MLKDERFRKIVAEVNKQGIVKVGELTDILDVSDMTIRRDLSELEKRGEVIRVHGGAKVVDSKSSQELSHVQKQQINMKEKLEVAKKIVDCIEDNDVVFLGAGTTIELVPELLTQSNLKIVTNSLPVFNLLQEDGRYEIILIGGVYRTLTGAFVGGITNLVVETIRTGKAFIGVNGIYKNIITNYNEEEGNTQRIILDNAVEKYIISDSTKLNRLDFYHFYDLENVTALITDSGISDEQRNEYSKLTKII